MSLISLFGLILGLVGSALVVLPTFTKIKYHINDQNRLGELENGRMKLSKEGQLFANDSAFDLVSAVIADNWGQELTDECSGFHRPKLVFENTDGNETYNRVMTVYSIDADAIMKEHPSSENYLQDIESILAIDSWIENEIESLRTSRIQRVRGIGFALIVVSVFIQGGITTL